MHDFLIDPLPNISMSDASPEELPLRSFHLVVIVEPDPESYMPLMDDLPKLDLLHEQMISMLGEELDSDQFDSSLKIVEDTAFIWLCYFAESMFEAIADECLYNASFVLHDYSDLEHFSIYLDGFGKQNNELRISVIGGMYEDDVIRVANLVSSKGFSTTILTRYCLSSKSFVTWTTCLHIKTGCGRRSPGNAPSQPSSERHQWPVPVPAITCWLPAWSRRPSFWRI